MLSQAAIVSARRDDVIQSYNSAKATNHRSFLEGNYKATSEYIYPNQIEDATNVVHKFYQHKRRIISVNKKTKVGADGFMIEVAKILTTHPDDDFVINPANVRIITGMSNASWEKDMIDKAPSCFKDKIFHHGKLQKADLIGIKDSLLIIDEIDSGDKEKQVLHRTLKDSGVLDVNYMETNNIRFIVISASLIKELYDIYRWGKLHDSYNMIIPPSYIGHYDFLKLKIIQEFYPLTSRENAEKCIQEDILDHYKNPCMCMTCNPGKNSEKTDYRVHIFRVKGENSVDILQNACIIKGVKFKNHTSKERLTDEDIDELFRKPLTQHVVLAVKGLLRRANLIPDSWKLRIGATHELYTKKVDNNVHNQGLPGRMTGHWKHIIEKGHKTGPYRTSTKAIEEIEIIYKDPFGQNTYQTSGFKKNKNGKVSAAPTMLSAKNIDNLVPGPLPVLRRKGSTPINIFDITEEEKLMFNDTDAVLNILRKYNVNAYNNYKSYEPHCWKMDTPDKCEKWGLNSMTKPSAYSTETNIREKTKNVIMIYLHENRLIISAWNGEETIANVATT